jgi:hypothetical protein
VIEADGSIGVRLGEYDARQDLVIDPAVLFTAYLAGTSPDVPIGIGHDKNGSIYIAGYTYSPDFVLVGQPYYVFFQSAFRQAFTTVMNPLGPPETVVTYSGFFSGNFGNDLKAMTVSDAGVFYLAGITDDFNFPVTPSGYLTANGGVRRSFVSVLDPKIPGTDGLVYSTFFAGTKTDEPTAIAFAAGKIYPQRLSSHASRRNVRWLGSRVRSVAERHRQPGVQHLSGRRRAGHSTLDRCRCRRPSLRRRVYPFSRLSHHRQFVPPVLHRRRRCFSDPHRYAA